MFLAKLLCLIPSLLCNESNASLSFDDLVEFYYDDIPNPAVIVTEFSSWRRKWLKESNLPSTLRTTLQQCDKDFYPNIHRLLSIACTLPVTSCENERANSTLKNIKTALRSTMGQERLSALTMMSIHSDDIQIDFDTVVDKFKLMCDRRIAL